MLQVILVFISLLLLRRTGEIQFLVRSQQSEVGLVEVLFGLILPGDPGALEDRAAEQAVIIAQAEQVEDQVQRDKVIGEEMPGEIITQAVAVEQVQQAQTEPVLQMVALEF
jgi:hypothetical protein